MNCLECGIETVNPKFCGRKCSGVYTNKLKRKNKKKCECGKEISLYADRCRTCCDIFRAAQPPTICIKHNISKVRVSGNILCRKCRTESITERRKEAKRILVKEFGGMCSLCGYSKCLGALHFHHVNPQEKEFSISHKGMTISLDKLRIEAAKCILICANCHAEKHN